MKAKFYKLRALLLLFLTKILAKIFFVEVPPIISVTALVRKGGKLLFIDLSYMKGVGFPGGVVQKGETLEEASKREVFEETGLTVVNSRYLGSEKADYKGFPVVSAIYLVDTTGKIRHSEEGRVFWLEPKKALGKMAYKDSDKTLKRYLEFHKEL